MAAGSNYERAFTAFMSSRIYEEGLFGPTNDRRRDEAPEDRRLPPIMPLLRIDF
jgi:hypothetical protein